MPLRNTINGKTYPTNSPQHPRKTIVFDDIYYGYLLLRAYHRRPLKMVQAMLSE